jgi:Na+/alanine symporter
MLVCPLSIAVFWVVTLCGLGVSTGVSEERIASIFRDRNDTPKVKIALEL